jgi:hypothetical protein
MDDQTDNEETTWLGDALPARMSCWVIEREVASKRVVLLGV